MLLNLLQIYYFLFICKKNECFFVIQFFFGGGLHTYIYIKSKGGQKHHSHPPPTPRPYATPYATPYAGWIHTQTAAAKPSPTKPNRSNRSNHSNHSNQTNHSNHSNGPQPQTSLSKYIKSLNKRINRMNCLLCKLNYIPLWHKSSSEPNQIAQLNYLIELSNQIS